MTPELLTSKHDQIDEQAEREKGKVEFIIDLIEQDEDRMRALLLTDDEREMDELAIAQMLFTRVSKALESMDHAYVAPFGVAVVHFAPNSKGPESPVIELGWEEYVEHLDPDDWDYSPDEIRAHGIAITASGLAVVNGLRQAQGDVTAEEQRSRNIEGLNAMLARPIPTQR